MRQVAHVLLTRPPLASFPKEIHSLDLHVLGTPPAFVLSQDQTLNKKFNLLLKLLWVFNNFKNSQKNCWIYFNYILFNFQRPYYFAASSDFIILSLTQLCVNNFFKVFWLSFVSNEIYLTTYQNTCQTLFYLVLFVCFASATRFILSLHILLIFCILIHFIKLYFIYSYLLIFSHFFYYWYTWIRVLFY